MQAQKRCLMTLGVSSSNWGRGLAQDPMNAYGQSREHGLQRRGSSRSDSGREGYSRDVYSRDGQDLYRSQHHERRGAHAPLTTQTFAWRDLSADERAAATELGYDPHMWEQSVEPLQLDNVTWAALSGRQRRCLETLGWDRYKWATRARSPGGAHHDLQAYSKTAPYRDAQAYDSPYGSQLEDYSQSLSSQRAFGGTQGYGAAPGSAGLSKSSHDYVSQSELDGKRLWRDMSRDERAAAEELGSMIK